MTQWFDPEPTFKGLLFARRLQDLGHEVEVITGFPNYPGGKLYPGFRQKWLSKSVVDGVKLTRVPLYTSHSSSAIGRVFNYVSFLLTSCAYGVFGAARADMIYVYHPPITTGVSAAIIGFFRGTPFVLDIQDLWPDTLKSTGMLNNEKLLAVAGKICSWTYKRAAHLVVLSSGFRRALLERGVPGNQVSVIPNWCDEGALNEQSPASPDTAYMDGFFNIVFAGNMGKAQALEPVLRAAQQAWEMDRSIQLVLVGGGVEVDALKTTARQLGMRNVKFVPRVPMNQVGAILKRADALLVHLKDDPLFAITIPSKTQAYMAVGKPLLMAVRGDAADMVVEARAGITATPENVESLATAMLHLARLPPAEREEMGRNGAHYYASTLSLEAGTRKFSDLFIALNKKK
ncbi:glycosyltransferase family 4 protein [Massilia sp. GCM10023247]|uniref:glycosyltransferase family 4 protein n=1 Tax=Massilia sp. GCM10023247 TaxID=3252643 RepID=UPI0036D32442